MLGGNFLLIEACVPDAIPGGLFELVDCWCPSFNQPTNFCPVHNMDSMDAGDVHKPAVKLVDSNRSKSFVLASLSQDFRLFYFNTALICRLHFALTCLHRR